MFKFVKYIFFLIGKAIFQLKASAKNTKALIHQLEQNHQGKFAPSAIQKAARFQAVQQIFINDAFANLIKRNTTSFERTSNKLYFILSGLYDDIIDQQLLSIEEIDTLFDNPLKNKHSLFEAKALVDVHLQLLKRTQEPEKYKNTLAKIHQAQKDSLKQFNDNIDRGEILDITLRKGGYSLLMCRHYIDLPISDKLDQCWYQLGGIIQFTNDLFDIYKDIQDGIHTYPNSSTNLTDLKECFDQLTTDWKETIQSIPYSLAEKETLLIKLSLIPAFGYLALENLESISNQDGTLASFKNLPRKALIIDMEKTKNLFKLIKYAYSIAKSN